VAEPDAAFVVAYGDYHAARPLVSVYRPSARELRGLAIAQYEVLWFTRAALPWLDPASVLGQYNLARIDAAEHGQSVELDLEPPAGYVDRALTRPAPAPRPPRTPIRLQIVSRLARAFLPPILSSAIKEWNDFVPPPTEYPHELWERMEVARARLRPYLEDYPKRPQPSVRR
jgi:hypothetical protein